MNYSRTLDKLVRGLELTDVWEKIPQGHRHTLHPTWSCTARPFLYLSEPKEPQDWSGNDDGGIHRSPGRMLAYIPRCTTATTRKGTMKNEYKVSGGGVGTNKIRNGQGGSSEEEISEQRDVVGKLCQKENPIHVHDGRKREGTGRHNVGKFYYACIYDILQESTEPRVKSARLNHLKAKNFKMHNKRLQAIR